MDPGLALLIHLYFKGRCPSAMARAITYEGCLQITFLSSRELAQKSKILDNTTVLQVSVYWQDPAAKWQSHQVHYPT